MVKFESHTTRKLRLLLRFKDLTDATGVFIGKGSRIADRTTIGDGSRINGTITIKGSGRCTIGKYAALGDQIKLITSNHRTDSVNLQYALARKIGIDVPVDAVTDITIGHNVWIGDNSLVLAGVRVGNGAIIGAGSIVTKDVAAYSVVAGAPAKELRKRFHEDRIREIEDSAWWDWSLDEMRANRAFFEVPGK
jgi:acetyltransferase-like isoleucine patch superfamily enzyme